MNAVELSDSPGRAELRETLAVLSGLARAGVEGAADQAAAIKALLRGKFPRRAKGDDLPAGRVKRVKGGRKRRLITAADCMGPCPACAGTGRGRRAGDFTWLHCSLCRGAKRIQMGQPQTIVEGPRKALRLRGELPPDAGVSESRWGTAAHQRGVLGGHAIGLPRTVELDAIQEFAADGRPDLVDPNDVASMLEGTAARELRAMTFGEQEIRGRRLLGSRRESGILTEGQGRRSLMADRVRKYQSQLGRAARKERMADQRVERIAVQALIKLGIDPSQMITPQRAVVEESAVLAEARRRGDLPPDDSVGELTDWQTLAAPTFGRYRGVLGSIQGAEGYLTALRADGSMSRENLWHYRIDFPDGGFEIYHADDIVWQDVET